LSSASRVSGRRALLRAALGSAIGMGASSAPRQARAQTDSGATCDDQSPLPARFRLVYDAQASRGPFTLDGENELVFSTDGPRYTLRSVTRSVLFNAEQESVGEVQGAVLVPSQYTERTARREPRRVQFDWRARRVTFSNADEPAPTQPLLQDRVSLLLQVGQQLRLQNGTGEVALPVASTRRISSYRLTSSPAQSLELPAGRFDTYRLERPLDAEHDGIEVWIAPQLCWLPVSLRYTDDRGQVIQNQLRSASFG
jgi:hypothetical protein